MSRKGRTSGAGWWPLALIPVLVLFLFGVFLAVNILFNPSPSHSNPLQPPLSDPRTPQPPASPPTPTPTPPPGGRAMTYQRGPTEDRVIALTFDAGWISAPTDAILAVLKAEGVKATFFPRGKWLDDNPRLAGRIVAEGHVLASHSYTHPDMTELTDEQLEEELRLGRAAVRRVSGQDSPYFRAPYGAYDDRLLTTMVQHGFYYNIMWTLDTLDWKEPGVDAIVSRTLSNAKPGAIVLMHVGSRQTPEALPAIISGLRQQGYRFVTVPELLGH
ncbi:MAG: polysaccharide deacetylase family protein [Bacillota bacterium]